MNRICLALLLCLTALASCEKATDPGTDDGGSGGGTSVALSKISDLPKLGGAYTDVEVLDDGILVIEDGKLRLYDADMQQGETINENYHFAIAAKDASHVYAIADNKQLRTYDLTTKTFKTSTFITQYNVSYAEFEFNSKGDPYVAIAHGESRGVIYYSEDQGTTWNAIPNPPMAPATFDITFDNDDNLLAVTPDGVYRTTDKGAHWTLASTSAQNFQGLRGFRTSDGSIYSYVKGYGTLRKSMDNGATFSELTNATNVTALAEGDDHVLYAVLALKADGFHPEAAASEFMRSTDGGFTWKHLLFCNSSAISLHGNSYVVLNAATGSGGAMLSKNNGSSWESRGNKTVENVQTFAVGNGGELYLLANFTLYVRANDHWETYGMSAGRFGSLAIGKDGKIFLTSTSTGDLFDPVTGTDVRSAFTYSPGIGGPVVLSTTTMPNGDYLVAIGFSQDFYYPSGALVRVDKNGIVQPNGNSPGGLISIAVDPNGKLYGSISVKSDFTGQFSHLSYTSADGGMTWTELPKDSFVPSTFSDSHFLQDKGTEYVVGPFGSESGKKITLKDFVWINERPSKTILTNDEHLYILSLNVQTAGYNIYVSTSPVS